MTKHKLHITKTTYLITKTPLKKAPKFYNIKKDIIDEEKWTEQFFSIYNLEKRLLDMQDLEEKKAVPKEKSDKKWPTQYYVVEYTTKTEKIK